MAPLPVGSFRGHHLAGSQQRMPKQGGGGLANIRKALKNQAFLGSVPAVSTLFQSASQRTRGTSTAPSNYHLPSNLVRQLAKLGADALGLFLVSIHDGILKQGAWPAVAHARRRLKSLDRLYRVVSLLHRHCYSSHTLTAYSWGWPTLSPDRITLIASQPLAPSAVIESQQRLVLHMLIATKQKRFMVRLLIVGRAAITHENSII